jgi:hypothetical protein
LRLKSFTFIKSANDIRGNPAFSRMPSWAGLKKPFFRPTSLAAFTVD